MHAITGKDDGKRVKGKVVLMKKNVLDFTGIMAAVVDDVAELLGEKVSFQLISSSVFDDRGKYYFSYLFFSEVLKI